MQFNFSNDPGSRYTMRSLILVLVFLLLPQGNAMAARALAGVKNPLLNIRAIRAMRKKIELDYRIYGAGISMVSAKFGITLDKGRYKATSLIQPVGLGNIIAQGRFDSLVTGRISSRGLRPKQYISDGKGGNAVYRVRMSWNNAARHRISTIPRLPAYRVSAVKKKLRAGMPDPLTSLLSATIYETRRPCRRRHRIIDGHTIWDLRYRYIKLDNLKGGSSGYTGPAYKCMVKYVPIAGQSARTLKLERQNPIPYVPVWFAPITIGKAILMIPVKINFPTKWANAVVHLRRTRIDGQTVSFKAK